MIVLCLLPIVISHHLVNPISALEYPRDLRDLDYIEQVTSIESNYLSDHEIADQVLDKLKAEFSRIQGQVDSSRPELDKNHALRNLILLKQYLAIADGFKLNCSQANMSDLLFLIDYHSTSKGSYSLSKYMEKYTLKVYELCKPLWDEIFDKIIKTKLDEWTKANMGRLIDSMVNVKFGTNAKIIPRRPFSRNLLRKLVTEPPASAIVLYLNRMGEFQVDAKMKNADLTWEDFSFACDNSLIPLCQRVCKTLEGPSRFYINLLNSELGHTKEAEVVLFSRMDNYLAEWLANKQICCNIVRSIESSKQGKGSNILEETYKKLVNNSEGWQMSSEVTSLIGQEFDYD